MSELRGRVLLALAFTLPLASGAQSAAEVRTRVVAARERAEVAESIFVLLRDQGRAYEASFTHGGMTVNYTPSMLTEDDRARITEGLRDGEAALRGRFGGSALAPLAGAQFWVDGARGVPRAYQWLQIGTSPRTDLFAKSLLRPIDPAAVADLVIDLAGAGLPAEIPSLGAYVQAVRLVPDPKQFEEAGRELALSTAASARRCAAGNVAACRAVLTPYSLAAGFTHWYDRGDYRALVQRAPEATFTSDSTTYVTYTACIDGDDEACAKSVRVIAPRFPFSGNIRSSLVTHALETGGTGALDRMRAAGAAGVPPLALLATTAGVGEDSLISAWQARTDRELAAAHGSSLPFVLSTAAWCGLLLLGATRRKP